MMRIEKQFFDTFEIGPFYKAEQCDGWGRTVEVRYFTNKEDAEKFGIVFGDNPQYPEITDSILLKLICIQNKYSHPYSFYGETPEFLKKDILSLFIEIEKFFRENDLPEYENFKHQVQALFKENN